MATQTMYRSAAVGLLQDCADDADVQMQIYRGRPKSLYPPTGFVDQMGDDTNPYPGSSSLYQHNPLITVILVWGLFDSGEAVDQRDAFVDAFHDTVREDVHAASNESLIGPRSLVDVPNYVPDWLPPEQQQSYFATRIELEGFATD